MIRLVYCILSGLLLLCALLKAEYVFFTPEGSFAVEVSLENSPYLRLPIYRNAITSLEVVGDTVIGGTTASSGLSPYLFTVSLSRRRVESVLDLARVIPDQCAIQSGFGRGDGGTLFAGTLPVAKGGSGHLIQVRVLEGNIEVKDLGVPVAREGVFALIADARRGAIYGVSHPSGQFFVFDMAKRQTRTFDQIVLSRKTLAFLHAYALNPEDVLSRRLALDDQGRVYGSYPVSRLFRFNPGSAQLETLPDPLPEIWGRSPLGRVDAWAVAKDGTLYGGNAGDGQLFKLDSNNGRLTNLGKPVMMPRLKGLAFGADGKLYGVGGASPGYAHLFSFDPTGKGFADLGNPRFTMTETGIEQGIAWRGFQIGTVAASEDGKYIVLGEEESLSQLMVFTVQ
jgi:hypothetical protein